VAGPGPSGHSARSAAPSAGPAGAGASSALAGQGPLVPARRRGRYAEAARNDRLVLDAAREVFTTLGFDAPVSAVAQRAGVGIGSLYRRYGSKTELLQRLCTLAMEQAIDAAQAALAAGDPWTGLAGYIRDCAGFGSGALAPLAGTIPVTPVMMAASQRQRELAEALVARAHEAGVLRADVTTLDVALLIEQSSRHYAALPAGEDANARERILAITLDGLRARDAAPLPGHPPDWRAYQARWQPSPATAQPLAAGRQGRSGGKDREAYP
jgi:AcrR family transcriptional regulator